jgi:hypothetical protein
LPAAQKPAAAPRLAGRKAANFARAAFAHCGTAGLLVSLRRPMIRNEGEEAMKRLTTALAAAGLMALAACGGSASNNVVANDAGNDTYNVAPDDLTAGNETGNEAGNASDDGNASGDGNAAEGNAE